MPLRAEGNSRRRAFGIGTLSGIVEPIGGALVLLLSTAVLGIMPYMAGWSIWWQIIIRRSWKADRRIV